MFSIFIVACWHLLIDYVHPSSLTNGLSAVGSGGLHFEESLHLCFTYLKNLVCGMKAIELYQYICTAVPGLLGGSTGGWLKSS